ncbi:porin [Oceanibium sediminis]|uniref:porin n=1 Tax=Oceanibium sediminis TaxID=2026339 RepID=UPI000DD3EFA1|nr:porin [Oceanibium sediminis]
MKNVLFATSALVSVAGVALADGHAGVALSGSAEMGITYLDAGGVDNTEFHNDIDVTFTLSGATENGLTFGASIDLDEADGGAVIESANSVFISGSFGTLSMGDVDGAYDKAHIELPAGGLNDEADQASGGAGLDGTSDGEILRYDYTYSDFTVSASLELEGTGAGGGTVDNIYGVGLAYSGDLGAASVGVGLSFQYTETNDAVLGNGEHTAIGVSASVGFGDFGVQGTFQTFDQPAGTTDIFGGGATYSSGAIGVGAAYERTERPTSEQDLIQGYITYDLTGGAELVGAASYIDDSVTGETTRAGFGLGLSF